MPRQATDPFWKSPRSPQAVFTPLSVHREEKKYETER